MSSYDARLLEVLKSLDAKERAVYWLRAWREGEEPPQELQWVQADDRIEYDKLLDRIQDAHNHTWNQQVIMQNWLAEDQSHLYWFASLKAAEERERVALAAVPAGRRRELSLPDPLCPHQALRGMQMLWGTRVEDAWSDRELRLSGVRDFLRASVADGISRRWHEQRAWELAFAVLGEELNGEQVMHSDIREFIADFKARVQSMAALFRSLGGEVELSEPGSERIQYAVESIMPERLDERLRREEREAKAKEKVEQDPARNTAV